MNLKQEDMKNQKTYMEIRSLSIGEEKLESFHGRVLSLRFKLKKKKKKLSLTKEKDRERERDGLCSSKGIYSQKNKLRANK
ncbi:hypothetical protein RchiOBHm_Chr7g0214101 [Rosa chinensis]|uniref:Uncharacterized protein n=1 Tax=Rosa chinensis TaxID=74649 RepID=A0A2P6PB58_ROSCH|nr:hypothetical protein RchiOBHm_Chr7g0214101 [Rosa chinensis]